MTAFNAIHAFENGYANAFQFQKNTELFWKTGIRNIITGF